MTIGANWAEDAYADASWVVNAWRSLPHVITVAIERVQIIARSIRTQIVGP